MSRRERLSEDRGFTLVEVLVAMVAGTVILMALFMVLDLSVRQSARSIDRVDASQRGRTAMEQLVQQLHSSCVAATVAPVLAGSDASNLKFLSQFGSAAVLTPNMHVVSLTSGSLVDTVYPATGGSAPTWTFSATPSATKTFTGNVSQAVLGGVTQPVFQYYSYVGGQLSTTPLPTPLSATDAADAVEVTIDFAVTPSDNSTEADRTINTTDSVVLRYVPASGSTTVVNLPCQ
jgi:prepilin-type N-terminal cleavage/methylation domain-containing protein